MINDQLPYVKSGDPIKAEHINAIVKALKLRTPRPSDTVSVRQTANGFVMDAASGGGGASSFRGAWCPTIINDELISLSAGSINDGTSTWTPSVSSIVVTANQLNYIYLHVGLTPSLIDGYVTGGVLSSAAVQATTSTQTNSNTDAYILLCTVDTSTGTVTRYEWFSFGCQMRNSGVGDVFFNYWTA